eukprot:s3279_g3.t1
MDGHGEIAGTLGPSRCGAEGLLEILQIPAGVAFQHHDGAAPRPSRTEALGCARAVALQSYSSLMRESVSSANVVSKMRSC